MLRDVLAAVAVSSMGMCQSNPPASEPTPSGLTCEEYQLIIDVELMAIQRCSSTDECTQLVDGFGSGCESDTPIVNASANSSYLYDMVDEAEGYGCTVTVETTGQCWDDAEAVCMSGSCEWVQ